MINFYIKIYIQSDPNPTKSHAMILYEMTIASFYYF